MGLARSSQLMLSVASHSLTLKEMFLKYGVSVLSVGLCT